MLRKHFTLILGIILLTGCGATPTAAVSIESAAPIATSVALTLEAWTPDEPEIAAPAQEAVSAVTPTLALVSDPVILAADYENALSVEMQLVIGTLKIDQTGQTIPAAQANLLLPLWQDLRTQLDTASDQALITSRIEQIVQSMTSDQVSAITALQLTQEDLPILMQELGLETGQGGRAGGSTTPGMQATQQAGGENEKPAGRGDGADTENGVRPGGGNTAAGGMPGLNSALVDAVIELLESKLNSGQ